MYGFIENPMKRNIGVLEFEFFSCDQEFVGIAVMITENYAYKNEVDWSLLQEELALLFGNQVVFSST